MAVILDADLITPRRPGRGDLGRNGVRVVPCEATAPDRPVWRGARVAYTRFGRTAEIVSNQGSGLRMTRRRRRVRMTDPERLALALHARRPVS